MGDATCITMLSGRVHAEVQFQTDLLPYLAAVMSFILVSCRSLISISLSLFFCKFSVTLLFHTMNIINSNKLFYFTWWLSETQGHVGVWRSQWKTWQRKQSSTQTKCDMHDNEHQGKWAFAVSHFFLCCFSLLYARSLSLPFTHFSCVFLSLSSALPPPFQLNVICMNC